jgi:hypothetical protein
MPTETVYGLAANALDVVAVARIFSAKNRPHFDPLIVHLSDWTEVDRVAHEIPSEAQLLWAALGPAPLTYVLPKRPEVPDLVTSGLDHVAVRIPQLILARQLLATAGVPVAAPSANPFGFVSPTTAQHVADQLGDQVAEPAAWASNPPSLPGPKGGRWCCAWAEFRSKPSPKSSATSPKFERPRANPVPRECWTPTTPQASPFG